MKFCTKCGRELKDSHKFCPSCRAEVKRRASTPPPEKQVQPARAQPPPSRTGTESYARQEPVPQKSRKPMSKRNKWITAGVGAAALILIPTHFALSSASSPDKPLQQFQEAVDSQDASAMAELLHVRATGEPVTEEHAAGIIEYIHSSPTVTESFGTFLLDQQEIFSGAVSGENYQPPWEAQFLSYENTGSRFFFYDKYELGLETYPLYVITNYDDASFEVNGEEVEGEMQENGMILLGDYPAGSYELSAGGSGDLADLTLEEQVFLHGQDSYTDMHFDLDYAYISSSVDDARLFMNGEDTGEIVGTTQNEYGPFLLDDSTEIHAEADTPFGILTSEPVPLDGSYGGYVLELEASEEIVTNAIENIEDGIEDNYDDAMDTSGTVEVLESVNFYTDNYQLYYDKAKWKMDIEAEESWLRGSEDFNTGDLITTPYTELKLYGLTYNEHNESWNLDQADFMWAASNPAGAVTTINVNDEESLDSIGGAEDSEDENNDSGNDSDAGNENSGEENDALNDYTENAESHIDTLINDYYRTYTEALYDVQFSRIVDENHAFFSYVDMEAYDFRADLLISIDEHATAEETLNFIEAEVKDVETEDEETYRVISDVEIEIFSNDGEIIRQQLTTEHDVILKESGFYVTEMIDTTVTSEETL